MQITKHLTSQSKQERCAKYAIEQGIWTSNQSIKTGTAEARERCWTHPLEKCQKKLGPLDTSEDLTARWYRVPKERHPQILSWHRTLNVERERTKQEKQKKTRRAATTDLRKLMTLNAIWQDMHMKAEFKRMGCILPRLLKDNCEAHEHHLHAHDTACTWWVYSSHSSCVLWSNQNSWYSGTHVHGHLFYHLEKRYINVLDTLIRYPYPSWLNFSWRYARTYVWNNELVPH